MLGKDSPLSEMIVGTTEEWYRAKHPRTSGDEVGLINSLSASACPYCGSSSIKKNGKRSVLAAIGYGKPSKSRVLEAMEGHVAEGSTRIDDGEEAHFVLVARYGLRRERHLSADTKGREDSRNPMNEINRRHRYFKMFMPRHGSYGRASIQDWCNPFSFAYNRRGEMGIMVEDFLGLALKPKKVMRYRTVMGSKTDKK